MNRAEEAVPTEDLDYVVLGAGISGLSAAITLHQHVPAARLRVYDATNRVGGVLQSTPVDGYLIEHSADSFLAGPQANTALQLLRASGMSQPLLEPHADHQTALILKGERTYRVPAGFQLLSTSDLWQLWRSPLLSWAGKLRLSCEPLIPRGKHTSRESLAEFARRRVGREGFERLVQPLASGIYTADPTRLSVAAAFPQFVEMEQKWGSLTRGLKQRSGQERQASGARYAMFRSPATGMQALADQLASGLPGGTIKLRAKATTLRRRASGGWVVSFSSGTSCSCRHLVLAVPAPVAADLLQSVDHELAEELATIPHAGVAVACLGFRREQIEHPLNAFGLVVPDIEQRPIVAISFASNKFPGRAPAGHVLLRIFLGGALRPACLQQPDDQLLGTALEQARQILRISGDPDLARLIRWPATTPQYHVGHLERVQRIETRVEDLPGLRLAGNAYRGLGVPQCIESGRRAAIELLSQAG